MGLLRQPTSDITKGVIWKQLLAFFFPLWFGTFFQQLYNTVDTLVVGRFVGKVALAAVGSTSVIVNLTVGIFTGLAAGAVVAIAQHFGARRWDEVHECVHTAMLLSILIGAFFMVTGFVLTPWALRAMGHHRGGPARGHPLSAGLFPGYGAQRHLQHGYRRAAGHRRLSAAPLLPHGRIPVQHCAGSAAGGSVPYGGGRRGHRHHLFSASVRRAGGDFTHALRDDPLSALSQAAAHLCHAHAQHP